MTRVSSEPTRLAAGLAAVMALSFVYVHWLHVSNAATVSTSFLLIVLVVAATSTFRVAVLTAVAAMACFNFYFLPPVGAWTIADPHNWAAFIVFVAVSLVASNLSAVARARTHEAVNRRDEMSRLFDLSRDVLIITDSHEALSTLARSIARRFDLAFVGIALPRGREWDVFDAGATTLALDRGELSVAFAAAERAYEFDDYARAYEGHGTMDVGGQTVRLVPLRVGTRVIGLLAAAGRPVEAGTFDALAGVVAIAIERARFLEERKTAELTRQSEELKTALLASLGHDLRTPLTAIGAAAANLQSSALTPDERTGQAELILTEVERLTRLFENILEMARIDAGAIAMESRWAHPSEIVAAACEQVAHALRGHDVDVLVNPDLPVRLDPRLTATALAHLLENAAQYTAEGSGIQVSARASDEGLTIQVRDCGPGIAPADLPRLFERFYRGEAARTRTSGSGMGLWIARELLAVEGGRLWAENCLGGGAQFTLVVPAACAAGEAAT